MSERRADIRPTVAVITFAAHSTHLRFSGRLISCSDSCNKFHNSKKSLSYSELIGTSLRRRFKAISDLPYLPKP